MFSPSLGASIKMDDGTHTSRASASHGSSRIRPKLAKQENASNHHPSDYRRDIHDCSANFGLQSGQRGHKESIHGAKHQCPFDQRGYKIGRVEKMKQHMRNLHDIPNPNAQNSESVNDSEYHTHKTQGQAIFKPTDRVNTNDLSNLDGFDSYIESSSSQIQSSYHTSCSSFASSDDFAESNNSMIPYANTLTYLNGIGHWVEDSSAGLTSKAWQNPELLLQHTSRFNVRFMLKPHVEEALDCFQTSFYGVGGATAEYNMDEHR